MISAIEKIQSKTEEEKPFWGRREVSFNTM
jgi:hypothetical protein